MRAFSLSSVVAFASGLAHIALASEFMDPSAAAFFNLEDWDASAAPLLGSNKNGTELATISGRSLFGLSERQTTCRSGYGYCSSRLCLVVDPSIFN